MADPARTPAAADELEEKAPSFSSDAEQQAFQSALMSQLLSAQSAAGRRDPAAAPHVADDVQLHVSPTQTNAHTVLCQFCDTKILLADAAAFCDKELSLHPFGGAKSDDAREVLTSHWLVPSQMNFENVGVTRAVDPTYRYLTCATCDKGPIGINFYAEPTKFYVAHARVRYATPAAAAAEVATLVEA